MSLPTPNECERMQVRPVCKICRAICGDDPPPCVQYREDVLNDLARRHFLLRMYFMPKMAEA